jgi:hypothetical protein
MGLGDFERGQKKRRAFNRRLDDRFHETTQLHLGLSIHGMRPFRAFHMIRTLEALGLGLLRQYIEALHGFLYSKRIGISALDDSMANATSGLVESCLGEAH